MHFVLLMEVNKSEVGFLCFFFLDEVAGEDLATTSWQEYKQERRGNVTIGDIGDWERHTRGIGMKLLLKMGYRAGEGLGRRSDGIVHAIQPVIFPKSV